MVTSGGGKAVGVEPSVREEEIRRGLKGLRPEDGPPPYDASDVLYLVEVIDDVRVALAACQAEAGELREAAERLVNEGEGFWEKGHPMGKAHALLFDDLRAALSRRKEASRGRA